MPGSALPGGRRVVLPDDLTAAESEMRQPRDLAPPESEPQNCLNLLPKIEPAPEEPRFDFTACSSTAVTRHARAACSVPLRPSSSMPALAPRQCTPETPAAGSAYPDPLLLTLDKLHFSEPRKKIFVRLSYRTEVRKTSKDSDISALVPATFVFPCSFHAIVFDVVKLDVFEHKSMGADVHVGRACVPLALLLRSDGERNATYCLRRRRASVSPEFPVSGLGENGFSPHSNGVVTVTLLLTRRKYARAAVNACPPLSDPARLESCGAGASPAAARPSLKLVTSSHTLVASSHTRAASSPQLLPTRWSPTSPVVRPFLRIPPSLSVLAMPPFHCGAPSPTGSVDSTPSESPTAESPGRVMPEDISCMEVLAQDESELADDEDDDDLAFFRGRKKSGLFMRIFSKNTRSLLNDFSAIYNAYFKNGWQLSKLEFMRCMVDLAKYYRENPA
ncbi:MAG: hypothetical protein BJ554DRAFT_1933 [Olpidium bornovanus]|uniref:Uncharacterized protein n=1 Tax=Olpidium bornovanus TaxID=278681 RepID=A0A8H8DGQ3_9FUNG|nr:MAG: hypothetical protein BJ554DRAFT_1933 [Olpidium bornovanus]